MSRLKLLIMILLFSFCMLGCQSTSVHHSPEQTIIPNYFPNEVFNQHKIDWYTKHLVALKEPSLYEFSMEGEQQCYRILVLPAFQAPVCYRIIIFPDGTGSLTAKKTNGKGGYETGKLKKKKKISLTKNQVDTFLRKLDKLGFWELPHVIDPIVEGGDISTDGESFELGIIMDAWAWVYEGVKNESYHVVSNMKPDDAYYDVADYLFQLLGL